MKKIKAEDYICQWCDETYRGAKEIGDWTSKEVMKFANDFAEIKVKEYVEQTNYLEEIYSTL